MHFGSTKVNDRSSRSHTRLVLSYRQINKDNSQKTAKLNLVDLAGSERIQNTGATGILLEQAKKINLSLTQLGIVINKLSEGDDHIPYRNSKLTQLLCESLGGNSKTTLICTTSRADRYTGESVNSLRFAQRVKKIKNKAKSNIQKSPEEMMKLIEKLKEEVFLMNKKMELIKLNPTDFDAIIDMD